VLEGNVSDFGELDRVEQGIVPQAVLEINNSGEDDRCASMMHETRQH
jgi:hypothetical protein